LWSLKAEESFFDSASFLIVKAAIMIFRSIRVGTPFGQRGLGSPRLNHVGVTRQWLLPMGTFMDHRLPLSTEAPNGRR
jgi:hypothetical protein